MKYTYKLNKKITKIKKIIKKQKHIEYHKSTHTNNEKGNQIYMKKIYLKLWLCYHCTLFFRYDMKQNKQICLITKQKR